MSESCTHNCESCGQDCASRVTSREDFLEAPHDLSRIKKVIGVVSGKGGVGKSSVTAILAVLMRRRGYSVAVLDADITGPSMPVSFGLNDRPESNELGLFPVISETGIRIMSLNLLMERPTDPVVWRGPIIAGTVKQFWTEVIWGDVDFMFVDMPPGTGDVPLTIFQSLPVDGVITVTTPQQLVGMIVEKAVNMARMMNVPVLGVVENMSYLTCPDCGGKIPVFGNSGTEETYAAYGGSFARMPLDLSIAQMCDTGGIEGFDGNYLDGIADMLESLI